jgi:hypothetical protein
MVKPTNLARFVFQDGITHGHLAIAGNHHLLPSTHDEYGCTLHISCTIRLFVVSTSR